MASRVHVLDKIGTGAKPVCRDRTKELVAAGLQRAVLNHGISAVAQAGECEANTIRNALAHTTLPELHTLGNILRLEPTVLWEYLKAHGFKIVPTDMVLSPDMQTAAEMSRALTTFIQALEDGRRTHRETCELAKLLRPLVQKLTAIIHEADEIVA